MTAVANRATDATTDMFTMAAQITPVLEHTVNTHIHRYRPRWRILGMHAKWCTLYRF